MSVLPPLDHLRHPKIRRLRVRRLPQTSSPRRSAHQILPQRLHPRLVIGQHLPIGSTFAVSSSFSFPMYSRISVKLCAVGLELRLANRDKPAPPPAAHLPG